MKKIKKLSIMTLLTVFLLSMAASSASANYTQWESEPNGTFQTADRLISYNINQAINQGYLSNNNDIDYWVFDYGTASSYHVAIQAPVNDNYYVIVYQKVGTEYHYVSTHFGNSIYFSLPGLSSSGVVPEYYLAVSSSISTVTPYDYYQIVVDPI